MLFSRHILPTIFCSTNSHRHQIYDPNLRCKSYFYFFPQSDNLFSSFLNSILYFCEVLYSLLETHPLPFMLGSESQCIGVNVCYKESRKFFLSTFEKQPFIIKGENHGSASAPMGLTVQGRHRRFLLSRDTYCLSLVHVNKTPSIVSPNFLTSSSLSLSILSTHRSRYQNSAQCTSMIF